jgi:hypothetical protein
MKRHLKTVVSLFLFGAFLTGGLVYKTSEAHAVRRMVLRGKLYYRGGGSKSFSWTLRYYPTWKGKNCFGSTKDRDGRASFTGTFYKRTGRFYLIKNFYMRRSGRKKFYYKGKVRGRVIRGTAHFGSYFGRSYATWRARILWTNRAPRVRWKRMWFRGKLYYRGGGSKSFTWKLKYNPRTGACRGYVRDRDGFARFSGSYNERTNRFYLLKHFVNRRRGRKRFYYKGRFTRRGARGTAHLRSYWGKRYASWSARRF